MKKRFRVSWLYPCQTNVLTYLNDGLGITLRGSHGDHVAISVHQNALGFHVAAFDAEVIGGIDDGDLL